MSVLNENLFQDESHAKEVKKLSDTIHDDYLRLRREEKKKRKSDAAALEKRNKMMKREEEEEEIKEEKVESPSVNGDSIVKIENGRNGRSCKKKDSYKFQDEDDTELAEEEEEEEDLKQESEDPVTTVNGGLDVEVH